MHRVLNIDLTNRTTTVENIPIDIIDKYIGGRGLSAYLLYRELPPGIDPLSPDNIIIFGCGPAQGTNAYYSSRSVLTTKSPYTGIYLYTVASGTLGHDIRKSGFTAIVIRGRSPEPTYVVVKNGEIQFRSAHSIWGKNTREAQVQMIEDSGLPGASCACIGPAGEMMNKMAMVVTGGEKLRAFARGGSGAVMGSKNLKGIVVYGSGQVEISDAGSFKKSKQDIQDVIKNHPEWLSDKKRYGTLYDVENMNQRGMLPTRNWQTGQFVSAKRLDGHDVATLWPLKNVSCGPYCINPCAHTVQIDRGDWKGAFTEGPEYETVYAIGSNCGVDQFDAIAAADQICDEWGIDSMSCGATIAFAMECYEKGLIGKSDTDGIELKFGNAAAMVATVKKIVARDGFGARLSEGVRALSAQIPASSVFAMHCKGLEFGGYECRGSWGQALQFALSPRGGCHHGYGLPARIPHDNPTSVTGKGELLKNAIYSRLLYDAGVFCTFTQFPVGMELVANVINAITGRNYSMEHLKKAALRIANIERLFNIREGLGKKDDYLPKRLLEEPLPDGPYKGSVVPMEALLQEGYQALGWDVETGVPLEKTLKELGLNDLAPKL